MIYDTLIHIGNAELQVWAEYSPLWKPAWCRIVGQKQEVMLVTGKSQGHNGGRKLSDQGVRCCTVTLFFSFVSQKNIIMAPSPKCLQTDVLTNLKIHVVIVRAARCLNFVVLSLLLQCASHLDSPRCQDQNAHRFRQMYKTALLLSKTFCPFSCKLSITTWRHLTVKDAADVN